MDGIYNSLIIHSPNFKEEIVQHFLSGWRYIAYLPHMDDEILCAEMLRRIVQAGRFLRLVVLTEGEQGWKNLPSHMVRSFIVEYRQRELERSCKLLGISNFEIWKIPDSGVSGFHPQTLIDMIKADILRWLPDRILIFARDGLTGHGDHEGAHLRVIEAVRQLGMESALKIFGMTMPKELIDTAMPILAARRRTVGAYPDCLTEFAPPLDSVIRVPINFEQKRQLVEIYESQQLGSYLDLFKVPELSYEFYLPIIP